MPAKLNLRATKKCNAHAFKKRVLQRALAVAMVFGFSAADLNSKLAAQYSSGDLPASPWSNRNDNRQTDSRESNVGNRDINMRLRQPGAPRTQGNLELRSSDRQLNETSRPAPVTLLGPMLPRPGQTNTTKERESSPPSTYQDSLQFPQEARAEPNSGRRRMPLGGMVLDSIEPALTSSPEFETEQPQGRLVAQPVRRIDKGLPDRFDEDVRIQDAGSLVSTSQLASTKTVFEREPITLRASSPSEEPDSTLSQFRSSSVVGSTRNQNNDVATTNSRPDSVAPRSSPGPASSGHSVREAMLPNITNAPPSQAPRFGQEGVELSAPPVNEIQIERLARAQRVSHETLSNTTTAMARAPEALESLPGFESVKRELKQRLDKCDSLLKRGAVLSAREEASQGLLRLYRTMDLHRGSLYSEPAYEKAMTAIREEADFHKSLRGRQGTSVQEVVDTHSTEALKNRPLESTSPEMAAMHYRWYARYQLVLASDGHPWAADLLYAYGKTLEKDAELDLTRANMFRNQAVVFYQAATQVAPNQSQAASQLGYALIHLDRIDDAYNALVVSIQNNPNANAWFNLAEVYRRTGKVAEAEYAVQQATALSSGESRYSQENPEVIEVDPAVFAKYSPMPTMLTPSQNLAPNSPPTSRPSSVESSVRAAKAEHNFFSKMFSR